MKRRIFPEIYLDHAAATPLDAAVLEAMAPFLDADFGNPSSLHRGGMEPRDAVEKARAQVAALIGCEPGNVVFTSGATEANNFAIKGVALASRGSGRSGGTVLISAIEHLSVLNASKRLKSLGFDVKELPVDGDGLVAPADLEDALGDDTLIVSVNLANPEVGTVEPVKRLAEITRERGVPFHCDAAAAAGWMPVDVDDLGVDLLTLSAQSFYGPKGAGALFIGKGVRIVPLIDGGPQEGGLRGGAENVPGVVGMGAAAKLATRELPAIAERLAPLRDSLIEKLLGSLDAIILTGHRSLRLPGHASFCVQGVEGEAVLTDLDAGGIAASSGSACSSHALKVSHVLAAMGVGTALARGSLVFTIGRDGSEDDIVKTARKTISSIKRLREISPL